ncbi:MAG: hemerythrin family protein [Treponema sp.]|nr:hemerythrin family protein [Treponema sp.]
MTTNNESAGTYEVRDYIKWDNKYAIGIPGIDAQHKRLIELCNETYKKLMQGGSSSESGAWKSPVKEALTECVDYAIIHFGTEEKLMAEVNYPDLSRHKKEHDKFTRKVQKDFEGFDEMTFTNALQFVKFLYDWILSHVAHEDKLIANFIQK